MLHDKLIKYKFIPVCPTYLLLREWNKFIPILYRFAYYIVE